MPAFVDGDVGETSIHQGCPDGLDRLNGFDPIATDHHRGVVYRSARDDVDDADVDDARCRLRLG